MMVQRIKKLKLSIVLISFLINLNNKYHPSPNGAQSSSPVIK